jgi:mannose-6-phosphate isomerase
MLMRLRERRVTKPWGRTDIPEQFGGSTCEPLGEIWFQRDDDGHDDQLLVKYLFTSERLSVQVHPDDAIARAAGHARGKDEAWVVIDAEPGATIGIGLDRPASPIDLKAAALDGSIANLLDWRSVRPGDAYYSPAGTLHSIGAGVTLLEVQQNCDVTYRLYDFGRPRELHLEEGLAAAKPDAMIVKSAEQPLGAGRSVVAQGPKFTLERWVSGGRLEASSERPLWLIPVHRPITANQTPLDPASVWIADEPLLLDVGGGGELIIAYEDAAVSSVPEGRN